MKFTATLITAILAIGVSARPQGAEADAQIPDATTIEGLVPDFGVTAGEGDDGNGNCITPIAEATIPCTCPPSRDEFLSSLTAAVQAGNTFGLPAPFPTDIDDLLSEKTRLATMLSVLQNIDGAVGQGCPAIATNFKERIDEIDAQA